MAVKTAPPTTEGLYRILYTVNGNVYWTDLVTAAEGVLTYKEPADPSISGYTFGGWEYGSVDVTEADEETGKVSFTPGEAKEYTFSAKLTSNGGSSSGGSISSSTTETTTNPDGSTTTTVTRPDGSKTATTQYPDGSTQVVELSLIHISGRLFHGNDNLENMIVLGTRTPANVAYECPNLKNRCV